MQRAGLCLAIGVLMASISGCLWVRSPREHLLPSPFELSADELAKLDRVLLAREEKNRDLKAWAGHFTRWEYDTVFGPADTHKYADQGQLKYAAPDKGVFRVLHTDKNGKTVRIEPEREKHWSWNEKSVFQFNHAKKQVIEYELPPRLHGKALDFGPFPLVFQTGAEPLKRLYHLRIVTPPDVVDQVWLEAYPRYREDAAFFQRAELLLDRRDMHPLAVQIHRSKGKSRTVYSLDDFRRNDPSLEHDDAFDPQIPFGWKRAVLRCPTPPVAAGQ